MRNIVKLCVIKPDEFGAGNLSLRYLKISFVFTPLTSASSKISKSPSRSFSFKPWRNFATVEVVPNWKQGKIKIEMSAESKNYLTFYYLIFSIQLFEFDYSKLYLKFESEFK